MFFLWITLFLFLKKTKLSHVIFYTYFKRLTENNNTVEARYEPIKVVDTPVTTSTRPIVSRHDVDVQCDIKLNENNSLINTTTNTNVGFVENFTFLYLFWIINDFTD